MSEDYLRYGIQSNSMFHPEAAAAIAVSVETGGSGASSVTFRDCLGGVGGGVGGAGEGSRMIVMGMFILDVATADADSASCSPTTAAALVGRDMEAAITSFSLPALESETGVGPMEELRPCESVRFGISASIALAGSSASGIGSSGI